ncbi:transcription factor fss1 [Fusarium flagelliforme]|uniref:Transcription factor fss1 n=1 Tax=Fusarium flagelliforme TaxID=2675880 RepID=A0A395ML33_9HYPO|nr:transcription factor fss1 [Fusarium flagelliforme]
MAEAARSSKWKRARGPKVRSGCTTWTKKKQQDAIVHRAPTSSKLLVPARLSPESFSSSIELDLCHHFRTCTVSELASSLNAMSFWHAYALPLSQDSKPVKAAIAALGGAHKAFKLQTQIDSLTQSLAQSYEVASIQQYNNAILVMREYMSSPERNFQVVLTCCLIFICIECLYGRYANVTRHLEAAFSLINTHHLSDYGPGTGSRYDQSDLAKFMEHIGPPICGLTSDLLFYAGNHSPKLVLELQKWLPHQGPMCLQEPGAPFFSAQAAASWLARIGTIRGMDLHTECPTCLTLGYPCGKDAQVCRRLDQGLDPESFFRYWSVRYTPFKLNFDPSTASEAEILRFKVLELEETIWNATFKRNSMKDDLNTLDCIVILKKAESIIELSRGETGHTFTFQANMMPPIAYVIISCQDEKIQWEGVRLLRSVGRREGVWDSNKVADIYANMITAKANKLLSWDDIPASVPQLAELLSSVQL